MRLTHSAVAPLVVTVGTAGVLQATGPVQIEWSAMWAGSMINLWCLGWYSCWILYRA